MSKFKTLLAALGVTLSMLSPSAMAKDGYDKDLTKEKMGKALESLSCKSSPKTCHQYAVIDVLSLVDACISTSDDDEKGAVKKLKDNWIVFSDKALKEAIEANEKLIFDMAVSKVGYLYRMPSFEREIMCESVLLVGEQVVPEEISDLLNSVQARDEGKKQLERKEINPENLKEIAAKTFYRGKEADEARERSKKIINEYIEEEKKKDEVVRNSTI